MTERDWLQGDDWRSMLAHLGRDVDMRTAIFYICGGLRRLWHLLYADYSREAVVVAENFEDGAATEEEVAKTTWLAESATFGYEFDPQFVRRYIGNVEFLHAIRRLLRAGIYKVEDAERDEPLGDPAVTSRLGNASHIAYHLLRPIDSEGLRGHLIDHLQAEPDWPKGWLVRDIFGNPFRPVVVQPRWRTVDVVGVARAIYDDRAFDRMPMLSDALLDADCDDEAIIAHCRSTDPHVRGCWVVDHALGLR